MESTSHTQKKVKPQPKSTPRKKAKKLVTGKPIWFYDNLYKANFYIYFGLYPGEIEEVLIKQHALDPGDLDSFKAGKLIEMGQNVIIWIHPDYMEVCTLVHEVCHAAACILGRRGVLYSGEFDEAFSYYVEWIINMIYSEANADQKIRVKGSALPRRKVAPIQNKTAAK